MMWLMNLLNGTSRGSATRRRAHNPLPRRRCLNSPLFLEALEGRVCPGVLTLTPTGISAGLRLSIFAADFPSGPTGVAFPDSGGVLVGAFGGGMRRFADDSDGQSAASVPGTPYNSGNADDMAKLGANIYMTQQTLGRVVQINDDGTSNREVVNGLPYALGIAANSATGHLYVVAQNAKEIYEVDPIAGTKTPFASGIFDGLTISADNSTLYATEYNLGHIYGFDTRTKSRVFDSNFIPGKPDGVAEGLGLQAGYLFVNCNNGTVVEVNITTKAQTLIATGGSRGDFVHVDPKNGSVLLTQSDRVMRLTFPPGPAKSLRIDTSANFIAGKPFGVSVTALDSYGAIATGYTGTVTFTSSDPYPGLLPSNYTFTPGDNGTHIFGAVFFTAGTQTLTAQDMANNSITGSARIAVHAAPANHIMAAAVPSAVAGNPFDVTITARDAFGNVDPDYRGTVTFTSTDSALGVALPTDYTFTSTDAGSHTFSATLARAGSQTITVTDKANGSFTANVSVNVTPASANHLALNAPPGTISGTSFDITVAALDPYGNVDTNYSGTITFTSTDSDPGVVLPADYTFQSTDNGSHTFAAGITLITPGDQTLTATDTANSTISSSTVVGVSPPPVPPPRGSANGPRSPSTIIYRTPVQPSQQVMLLDRLFASVSGKDQGSFDQLLPVGKGTQRCEIFVGLQLT